MRFVGRQEGHPSCRKILNYLSPEFLAWKTHKGSDLNWSNIWEVRLLQEKATVLPYLIFFYGFETVLYVVLVFIADS